MCDHRMCSVTRSTSGRSVQFSSYAVNNSLRCLLYLQVSQECNSYSPHSGDCSAQQRDRVDRLGRAHRLEGKLAAETERRVAEEVDGDDRPIKDVRRVDV